MRTVLLKGGIETFVSSQEYQLIEQINSNQIDYENISEKDQYILETLFSKGILVRNDDKSYRLNTNKIAGT